MSLSDEVGPSASGGAGDQEAEIEALFRAHAHRLTGYVRRLGVGGAVVDDLVQDSFLALQPQWAVVRCYEKPEAYLYKIATNRVRRMSRDSWYTLVDLHAEPQAVVDSVCLSVEPDLRTQVEAALGQLPRRQHEVVLLRHLYGFSGPETADILQISVGTVKSYLSEGLRRLGEILKTDLDSWEGEQ